MVLILIKYLKIRSLGLILNLVFSGTVALCAGCNVYEAWAAVVVGAICNCLLIHCLDFDQIFRNSQSWIDF